MALLVRAYRKGHLQHRDDGAPPQAGIPRTTKTTRDQSQTPSTGLVMGTNNSQLPSLTMSMTPIMMTLAWAIRTKAYKLIAEAFPLFQTLPVHHRLREGLLNNQCDLDPSMRIQGHIKQQS